MHNMHSATTFNADDVIMVGSRKTQDSLNTQHVSYVIIGNNGSYTGNDACICQNRLHVDVHNRHVMTGKILDTRVIMDLHLGQ